VQRYGFHGLSYEYIASKLHELDPALAKGRVIVCHLGSGASMCAIDNGRSVEHTLGFSANDGLPMGTRTGPLDPGVILYLLQQKGMDANQIEKFLYKDSGLLGLSGISNDMRVLQESDDPHAKEAVDFFIHCVVRQLGALTAVLGGLDGVVFTAGIGEHSPSLRADVVNQSAWLGLAINGDANKSGDGLISAPGSKPVWVIPTDEELMIASHTRRLLREQRLAAE
jgi:acetate kinase